MTSRGIRPRLVSRRACLMTLRNRTTRTRLYLHNQVGTPWHCTGLPSLNNPWLARSNHQSGAPIPTKHVAGLPTTRVWHRVCPLHMRRGSQVLHQAGRVNSTRSTQRRSPRQEFTRILANIQTTGGIHLPTRSVASLQPYRAMNVVLEQSSQHLADLCSARSNRVPRDHKSKPAIRAKAPAALFATATKERSQLPP